MGVVEIEDFDAIRRPDTSGGHVFSVEDVMSSSRPLTKEQVMEMFPDVFDEGLALDLVYVSSPEEEWKDKNLSRPEGS